MNKPREPIMNCDLCNTDYPESHLLSVGMVMWTGVQKMEMFLCEECVQKASNALKKRKEHKVIIGIKEVREVQDHPRNTQFQGFAEALFDQLYDQFNNLHYQEDDGRDKEAEQTREGILETIAEAGHDLAVHAVKNAYDIDKHGNCGPLEDKEARIRVSHLPDLTELPKEQER